MNIPPNDEIRTYLGNASAPVRNFIASPEFVEAFLHIRATHKLHFDEAEKLGNALIAVFTEARPVANFPVMLREALEQNRGTYDAVLADINEKIFSIFRLKLARDDAPVTGSEKNTPKPLDEKAFVLEKKTSQNTAKVALAASEPLESQPPTPSGAYKATDPYREPLE